MVVPHELFIVFVFFSKNNLTSRLFDHFYNFFLRIRILHVLQFLSSISILVVGSSRCTNIVVSCFSEIFISEFSNLRIVFLCAGRILCLIEILISCRNIWLQIRVSHGQFCVFI